MTMLGTLSILSLWRVFEDLKVLKEIACNWIDIYIIELIKEIEIDMKEIFIELSPKFERDNVFDSQKIGRSKMIIK